MKKEIFEFDLFGKKIKAEFNDLVNQANGSVIVSCDNTLVLATAIMSPEKKVGIDFLPLSVEFEEKSYAAGKIIGSQFQKREGRPTDEAVLSGRIVDRTIRPLFDKWIRNDIQIVLTVLSLGDYDPDFLSVLGASLALSVSNIPFNGPVSSIRILKDKNGKLVLNPTFEQRKDSYLEILSCGTFDKINMIEMASSEAQEGEVMEALAYCQKVIKNICDFQSEIIKKIGVKKIDIPKPIYSQKLIELYEKEISSKIPDFIFTNKNDFNSSGKEGVEKIFSLWKEVCDNAVSSKVLDSNEVKLSKECLDEKINDFVHKKGLEENIRFDGRKIDEIRPLFAKAGGLSESLHGSGIFYRGGTHLLAVTTLGSPEDALVLSGMEVSKKKYFMLDYNFPPYSVGEVGRFGGLNRRMIGHGALAEKSFYPVLPSFEEFPYTIRTVAESMSSNGSTSMASVCATTLSLMDAGVPIKKHVAGIASGLMTDQNGKYIILTDIAGPEDHYGDMDFKVSGTLDGITAVQMDVKVSGVSISILKEAFDRAKKARFEIIEVLSKEIKEPRKEISSFASFVGTVKILPDQIGLVIGPSGKTVNEIRSKTDTSIKIEDNGTVYVVGKKESVNEAVSILKSITKKYEVGDRLTVTILNITDFGAFASISPTLDGLIHISEITNDFTPSVDKFLKVGDKVPVIIKDIDEKGRYRLSIKSADPEFFKNKK